MQHLIKTGKLKQKTHHRHHRHGDKNIPGSVPGMMEPGKMEPGDKLGKTELAEMLGAKEGAHVGSG